MSDPEYFHRIRDDYQEATHYQNELYESIATRLNRQLRGKVVDFGNGGVVNYETHDIEKLICVDIINQARETTSKKIDFVHGDFYDFNFPGDSDCVLAQFLFHHLPDHEKLAEALKRLNRSLEPGRKLLVVETVMPRSLEILVRLLGPLPRLALGVLQKPEVRFFSLESLSGLLGSAGFGDLEVEQVDFGRRVAPAPVLFPRLRIPGWLHPLRCVIVKATSGR